jgi:hypothetical protein
LELGRGDLARPLAEEAAKAEGETGLHAGRIALRLRLEAHDAEGARAALDRLRPRSGPDDVRAAEGAVFEEAVAGARRFVEGPRPDLEASLRSLAAATGLARTPEDETAQEDARAYVTLASDPTAWRTRLPRLSFPKGRQVVVFSDDFALGEDVLASVLRRWAQSGVPVSLVGRLTGEVREGVRHEKAGAMGEQRRFTRRAQDLGATFVGAIPAGGEEERALGLRGPGAWVFVVDAESRLVGRASGLVLDPRPLESLVLHAR